MVPAEHVRYLEGFVHNPRVLLEQVLKTVAWDSRLRSRKTASFGVAYNYSGIVYPEVNMPPELEDVANALHEEFGYAPNNCLLNYYPDGESSMGFHSDSSAELAKGTGIAIVSLGAERQIVFRNKADRNTEFSYLLANGSLLYMTAELQRDWQHAIPKQLGVGARISLTFRQITS